MGADDGIKISNDFEFGDLSGMRKEGYKEVMPIGLSQTWLVPSICIAHGQRVCFWLLAHSLGWDAQRGFIFTVDDVARSAFERHYHFLFHLEPLAWNSLSFSTQGLSAYFRHCWVLNKVIKWCSESDVRRDGLENLCFRVGLIGCDLAGVRIIRCVRWMNSESAPFQEVYFSSAHTLP